MRDNFEDFRIFIGLSAAMGADAAHDLCARTEQNNLVAGKTHLPKQLQNPKELFEKIGFKFGDPIPDDKLFVYGELPPGWKMVSTASEFWTQVQDEKGRDRVSLFYRSFFLDREAFMRLNKRFCFKSEESKDGNTTMVIVEDHDGKWIYRSNPHTFASAEENRCEKHRQLMNEAKHWMDSKYPGWNDLVLCWELL